MYHGSGGGMGLDWLWPMGLDRSWVLDFGFGIGVDLRRSEIVVIFFYFLFFAWFDGGSDGGVWLGLN